jgi:CRISPR-associated protein (TIGR02584 family)
VRGGCALSLFGRPQDRLSHILVTHEFEAHPEFVYPTLYELVTSWSSICAIPTLTHPRALNCADAKVQLAARASPLLGRGPARRSFVR